jgi:hypothetical protein
MKKGKGSLFEMVMHQKIVRTGIITLIIFLMAMLLSSGCVSSSDPSQVKKYSGTEKNVKLTYQGSSTSTQVETYNVIFELYPDGTMCEYRADDLLKMSKECGTYKIDGNTIELAYTKLGTRTGKINGDTIVFTDYKQDITYKK